MRICLDISPLVIPKLTGVGNYTLNLCNSLIKNNPLDEFVLFAFCPIAELKNIRNLPLFKYKNIKKEVILPLPSKLAKTTFIAWQKCNFPSIELFIGPCDIYHNFDWYLPPVNNALRFSTIFDLTTVLYPEHHKDANVLLQNTRINRLLPQDHITTISKSGKEDLQKYNRQLKNITVIYPGCNEAFKVTTASENNVIASKYSLNKPFILTVSTLEPRKNLTRLIEAYTHLADSIEDELVIVGDIGWKNSEMGQYKDKKWAGKIRFLNYVPLEDLVVIYNLCHFFAYVSLYEGFGIPPLEAMRVGKHVVVSNTSSLPEVVGQYAELVNPSSVDEIREALKKMANTIPDKQSNSVLIEHSYHFSYDTSAQLLHDTYKNALMAKNGQS